MISDIAYRLISGARASGARFGESILCGAPLRASLRAPSGPSTLSVENAKAIGPKAQAARPSIVPLDQNLELVGVFDRAVKGDIQPTLYQLDAIALVRDNLARLLFLDFGLALDPIGEDARPLRIVDAHRLPHDVGVVAQRLNQGDVEKLVLDVPALAAHDGPPVRVAAHDQPPPVGREGCPARHLVSPAQS
jgi:hypothetical protein